MKKNIRKLSESFLHAFRGLGLCVRGERNFRVHMTAAFYVIAFALMGRATATQAAILCICFGLTMSAELMNTAIERLCDRLASALARRRVPELLRLLAGAGVAKDHVAQHHTAGIRLGLQLLLRFAVKELVHREGQHIRRAVDIAHGAVDGADALVVRHKDVDLAGRVDALMGQDGVEDIQICRLTPADVVRHVLVQRIVAAYDKYEKNRLPDERARTFTKKPDWKREKK